METRNVQRTGKMHYVYLPTGWCRKHKITSASTVSVEEGPGPALTISPTARNKHNPTLDLTLPAKHKAALINLIMACYVNPTQSFKIHFDKKTDFTTLLDQKNIVSALEFVEIDDDHISYESSMSIHDPDNQLNTMLKKIKNLLYVMQENPKSPLIEKYEEEIDRGKILIQKSVISSLVQNETADHKPIDLYFIVQTATELERLVDTLLLIDRKEKQFFAKVQNLITNVKDALAARQHLDYLKAAEFAVAIHALPDYEDYAKMRVKKLFQAMAELIFDWAIAMEVQK